MRGASIRRQMRNSSLVLGAVMTLMVTCAAAFAPAVARFDPNAMDMERRLAGPSRDHWFGTDNFGRDLWARLVYGARISLPIAVVSVAVSVALGTAVGLTAGYFGGWVDLVLMRIGDVFLSFPVMLLALAVVAVLGPGPTNLTIALVTVFWAQHARVVRSVALAERDRYYVEAARALGASHGRIVFLHILPNAIGPVLVLATLGIGLAVVSESGLSFLGVGVQPPAATWGWTLAYGVRYLRSAPWLSTLSGSVIMFTVLGFNLLGDGLRSLLDRRSSLM